MLVPPALRLAEPDPVDHRRVVQLVRDDGILRAQQLLKDPGVGVEAAGVKYGVFLTMEARDLPLKVLFKNVLLYRPSPHFLFF